MKKKTERKVFVIDTNIILHDHCAIEKFEEHDVVIPITVVEELDYFKKGFEAKNFNAREFIRTFDALSQDEHVFNGGTNLGKGLGKIQLKICSLINPRVKELLAEDTKDHRILSIVCDLEEEEGKKEENEKRIVIFVSKDSNLRIKARALKIKAEDYKNDKVKTETIYSGVVDIKKISDKAIQSLNNEEEIPFDSIKTKGVEWYPNTYLIFDNIKARINKEKTSIKIVKDIKVAGIFPKNTEQSFALNALLDPEITLVSITGKAGTGKTLLALAAAINQTIARDYDKVLLARPIVELSNKTLGFLPGDEKSKISPYMQPLFDNLAVIKKAYKNKALHTMESEETLEIIPLAYVRGRSLNKCFWIIDEAQNLTPHEVKTIITRAGEGTKIVFTGDPEQIDDPYLDSRSNGLSFLVERWKGQKIYAHINLEKGERSHLAELASQIM